MRKLLFAGAVAGGFLLLGGAPAHADGLAVPAGAESSSLDDLLAPAGNGLDPAGGLNLESPLGGNLVDVKPGDNTPGVDPSTLLPPASAAPAAGQAEAQPDDQPHGRGLTPPRGLPGADMVGGAMPRTNGAGLPVIGGLLGGGGVLGGGGLFGGLPAGGLPAGGLKPGARMPAGQSEAGPVGSGLPLLDGIAGALPGPATPGLTMPAIDPTDFSGMPAGGVPVTPAGDQAPTDATTPAGDTSQGHATNPGTGATDDDKRLHEEPIDDEAARPADARPFSADSRPVAGVDPAFD